METENSFTDITAVNAAEVFGSAAFIENYTYDKDDLGAAVEGDLTVFRVWAPTASAVSVNLFDNGTNGEAYLSHKMTRGEKGTWECTLKCGHGTYYTYTVTTASAAAEAVDPYAKAVGINGDRGMVVDLRLTDPDGFENDKYIDNISTYSDAVVWETHVRDFSVSNDSSAYKGKYLAFTEDGLRNSSGLPVGLDHLVSLGITHVQLMPVFDFATVDETCPDSSYNWGYDPKNWNAPEGSFSIDPYHGEVRIREFKQLVQALHSKGIGVVMDVVYNHTFTSDSSLNRIVPYYYYRYTKDGQNSNGSGCGNETASERVMFRRYMISSLSYWMKEYHLDGFRFDLMGVFDIAAMNEIDKTLHAINPNCLLYGEGWSGGECALALSRLASRYNIKDAALTDGKAGGIAVFNDVTRDALKGTVFDSSSRGYISGLVTREIAEKVAFGIEGGAERRDVPWSVNGDMVVNYMSAHDNRTVWDKLALSCPGEGEEERARMNAFGAAIIMISHGMPFFLSGEEMLRTKGGDENSYKSPDSVNSIAWESFRSGSPCEKMFLWYRNLIAMRRKYLWLRKGSVKCTVWDNNSICAQYYLSEVLCGIAIINPTAECFLGTLPEGEWKVILDGEHFLNEAETVEKCISVPVRSVVVLCSKVRNPD